MRLIVGMTGASGAIYGIRLLEVLSKMDDVETHLIISEPGAMIIKHETDYQPSDVAKLADYVHDINNIAASVASGSFQTNGMVIIPCTAKTLSSLANSYGDNLLTRVGDVVLKERKRLVIVFRETPLHIGHLRNMLQLTEMGAIIVPPVPGFYLKPKAIDDLVLQTVARVLDLVGIEHSVSSRWTGMD